MEEVYLFDEAAKLKLTKYELGGKGYGLVEMTSIGLPVPLGIVITTRMCNRFFEEKKLWKGIKDKIVGKMRRLEAKTGKKFGSKENPLLVSVRSGAPVSMPGMMDTVLNLGINDEIAEALAKKTDERFAYDTYRRFLMLFGSIVMKVERAKFDAILDDFKKRRRIRNDSDISGRDMREIAKRCKELISGETGKEVPQEPLAQLFKATEAIFASWWNKRAMEYRKIYGIPDNYGTAVDIVAMVYGNYDDKSGTGVAFTRDPNTGEKKLYAEVLLNAQGEDVVAGIRTPMPAEKLKNTLPEVYASLERTAKILEKHFRNMQDMEFTIESGKFYMLQTRNGKRTAQAAVKIAIDMQSEGLISKKEALMMVEPEQLQRLFYKQIDQSKAPKPLTRGLPASPGAVSGKVVFELNDAINARAKNEKTILVRPETTPEDIAGIAASDGILTSRGGMTSHAAVVTRGMGKPCIVGAEEVHIDSRGKSFMIGRKPIRVGDMITIDGSDGSVYYGELELVEPKVTSDISRLLQWSNEYKRLGIRANADTPEMVRKAIENGAEGVGLARTERMFNSKDRLELVRKMILSSSVEERKKYLDMIKPMQKKDFREMLAIAKGRPFTIRLLDIPLHEFLPKLEDLLPEVTMLRLNGGKAAELKEKEAVLGKVMELREANPMMGQRGVRLALVYKEIYEMQVEAMLEAALELEKSGTRTHLEIMVSQVAIAEEFRKAKEIIEATAEKVFKRYGRKVGFSVGTMIETPRAALVGGEIAKYAEFFSFGTNDLTQGTFAFSRDDVEAKFMHFYIENGVLPEDPFATLDRSGAGRLVALCTKEGKEANKKLEVGICGEHGGDPKSIEFFDSAGLDYVSMSPYRVPVAKLAAARAEISAAGKKEGGSTV